MLRLLISTKWLIKLLITKNLKKPISKQKKYSKNNFSLKTTKIETLSIKKKFFLVNKNLASYSKTKPE